MKKAFALTESESRLDELEQKYALACGGGLPLHRKHSDSRSSRPLFHGR